MEGLIRKCWTNYLIRRDVDGRDFVFYRMPEVHSA